MDGFEQLVGTVDLARGLGSGRASGVAAPWQLPLPLECAGLSWVDVARAGGDVDVPAEPSAHVEVLRKALADPAAVSLDDCAQLLIGYERARVGAGSSTEQTSAAVIKDVGRLLAWARREGAQSVAELGCYAEEWIESPARTKAGVVMLTPPPATRHRRRSVVRRVFATLREWGLTNQTPAVDVVVPARPSRPIGSLGDDELVLLTSEAAQRPGTAYPVLLALAAAGVTSGESCRVSVHDVDLAAGTVAAPGGGRTRPRLLALQPMHIPLVVARIGEVRAGSADGGGGRLVYGGRGPASAQTSYAAASLARLFALAGLPGRQPKDLVGWAARKAYESTGRVQDAARVLGTTSLDRAARAIGLSLSDGV